MSYRIEKGEGLASSLGRIASEEMDLALTELRRRDRGEAIHSVRKAIKRLRALLRSLRVAFPKKLFRAEDQRLAEAGRKMSPLRDVHVQLRTLGKLRAAKDSAGGRAHRDLLRQQENFTRKIPVLRRAVRRMLGGSRGSIESWPLAKTTPAILSAGLKRVYAQGRKAFRTACKSPTPENLHEWRKKAKSLGYGFELIESVAPKEFSKRIPMCQALGDALGDDHDLFMVQQALGGASRSQPSPDDAGLARRIAARRSKLQKKALRLGKKVFRENTRAFAKCLDWHLE